MLKAKWFKHNLIFRQPTGTSRGTMLDKETFYLHVWLDENPETNGIGECSLLGGLSIDDRPGYESMLNWVCLNINSLSDSFHARLRDWPSIRFGLEMALLDLQQGGNRLLFPSDFTMGQNAIPINGLVWMGDKDFMLRQIDEKLEQGFTVVKMKVGAIDFEAECSLLEYIRSKYDHKTISIRLDANGAFTPDDVFRKLEILSKFDIHSIEQPITAGQTVLMTEISRTSPIPVTLDEELIGVHSMDEKKKLLQTIKPQYIILKPSLLGGFASCNEWISIAEEMGIAWWVTSALESNIGLNAIAQWTATLNNQLPQGLGTGSLYTNNIGSPLQVRNGFLHYNPFALWDLKYCGITTEIHEFWALPLTLNGQLQYGIDWLSKKGKFENGHAREAWMVDLLAFLKQWYSNEDVIRVNTSGSTGKPKQIEIKKIAMIESAKATGGFLGLADHPTALLCLSTRFIAGMMMVVRAMVYQQNLIAVNPDGNPLLQLADDDIPDFAAMVPAQVYNTIENPASDARLRKIRTLIIGGGDIHPQLEERIKDLPHAVFATYGMTETITHVALRRITGVNPVNYFEALPGILFSIDKRGCLVINAPERNSQPYISNDLVELISQNKFRWLGRIDNIINRGGEKLIPEMFEKKMAPHIQYRFFVAGIPDTKLGQVPALFIETENPGESECLKMEELLKQICLRKEMPVKIFFVTAFEETENGKVNRRSTIEKLLIN